jgi:hypothetical protein
MAIIEEIDESLFISRFEDYKRVITDENKNGNFTYKGLRALFEYLDDLSEDTGENINLDVIALCCDYLEYKNLDEYLNDYYTKEQKQEIINEFLEENDYLSEEEKEDLYNLEEFKKFIENRLNGETTLIKFSNDLDEGFIIQSY